MTSPFSDAESVPRPRRPWLAWLLSWKVGLPAAALLLAVSGVCTYREAYVWDVPDIGEPFDLESLEGEMIPPEQNAWTDYEATLGLLVPEPSGLWREVNQAVHGTWEDATPAVRDWLADNDGALERWRVGTEKNVCMRVPPRMTSSSTMNLNPSYELRDLDELAGLQRRKIEATGDMDAAWPWYRASFRYTRHIGLHEGCAAQHTGCLRHSILSREITRWAGHDDVTSRQLAMALHDVRAAYALSAPPSRAFKIDYLWLRDVSRDVDGYLASMEAFYTTSGLSTERPIPSKQHLSWQNEPLLTQRLLKHQTANLLLFIDKPLSDRPPLISGKILYFNAASARQSDLLSPAHFVSATGRTWLAGDLLRLNGMGTTYPVAERANQAALEIVLAAEHFSRDRGVYPEHLEQLVAECMTPEIPIDPWSPTGEPMCYARDPGHPSRARVWSVGPNQLDDGGDVSIREPLDSGYPLGNEQEAD